MSQPRPYAVGAGRRIFRRHIELADEKTESCRLQQVGDHREVWIRFVRGQEPPDGLGWQPPAPRQFGFGHTHGRPSTLEHRQRIPSGGHCLHDPSVARIIHIYVSGDARRPARLFASRALCVAATNALKRALAASICPKTLTDTNSNDFAYRPAFSALIGRIATTLK